MTIRPVEPERDLPAIAALHQYRAALACAADLGATRVEPEITDDDPTALPFAQRRGFAVGYHRFKSARPTNCPVWTVPGRGPGHRAGAQARDDRVRPAPRDQPADNDQRFP